MFSVCVNPIWSNLTCMSLLIFEGINYNISSLEHPSIAVQLYRVIATLTHNNRPDQWMSDCKKTKYITYQAFLFSFLFLSPCNVISQQTNWRVETFCCLNIHFTISMSDVWVTLPGCKYYFKVSVSSTYL